MRLPAAVTPIILPVAPETPLSSCSAGHSAAVQGDSSSLPLPGVASWVGREQRLRSNWKDNSFITNQPNSNCFITNQQNYNKSVFKIYANIPSFLELINKLYDTESQGWQNKYKIPKRRQDITALRPDYTHVKI